MRRPLVTDCTKINEIEIKPLILGEIPTIIIRNFFNKELCAVASKKIEEILQNSQDVRMKHIGPFLMSYATKKNEYFEAVKKYQKTMKRVFSEIENPIPKIHQEIGQLLQGYSVNIAKEGENTYSEFIIRINYAGESIPTHKDNVGYEGKEYSVSNIDHQLSCILHLQRSEEGGELVVHEKQWNRDDEKFRNIDFGYSLKSLQKNSVISDINEGDLVIINTRHDHEVKKILGTRPRITLGMFLGIYQTQQKVVTWA